MSDFTLICKEQISSLNIVIEEYEHIPTGTRHLHLAADDNNNAFLVAFLTEPEDSTGVAHILEHTSLCGSKRYPVRDPFFMMLRRSLNTFMNAFTSSDWTAYPFASQNVKDFNNLLEVYLDATFFPNLDVLDFAQEGHRLEFETPHDPESPLVYKGVVFNEMKGALSSPVQRLWQAVHHTLFPTITYHYNSGGEPKDIPQLTHAQLKAFHATHYHPSNAIFMTYGDRSAESHQKVFAERVLQHYQKTKRLHIPNEQRYDTPQQAT
ncbi:MAG: insulinase family protein, partial [Thiomargarita sp.]|nr:insulinase family protein [Thiomargarita sp.]